MTDYHFITANDFRQFSQEVLTKTDLSSNDADDVIEPLVYASLRGIDTHGVRNFKSYYVDTIVDGSIDPQAKIGIEFETPMSARATGNNGNGLVASAWGMRLAIEKAAATGIGMVSIRNSNHLGAAGYFAYLAVEHDMIGVSMSGHLYGNGTSRGMAPVFSLQPMFGTNPFAVAIPCEKQPPFVLDMSTSVVPVNKVEFAKDRGESIPIGWCLDENGNPTSDPATAKIYLPLGGSRETGGHKGFGLAIIVEAMTALLSAGWADGDNGYSQDKIAHFMGAFRIDMFREPSDFKVAMDAMIDSLHQAAPAAGHDRVYVPGEIEHETQQERLRTGIPLSDKEVADLLALSEQFDVPLNLLR
ncbi:MAG: malate dehydrogenase [Planctomycetaceae bacterium]|nr:malate dehydrogenase [Planctomycetaceae bacterium]